MTDFILAAGLDDQAIAGPLADMHVANGDAAGPGLQHRVRHSLRARQLQTLDPANARRLSNADGPHEGDSVALVEDVLGSQAKLFAVAHEAALKELLYIGLLSERMDFLSHLLGLPKEIGIGIVERRLR
ncbi:hypothetical protein [Bradyrhizobium sp. SSUT77]|uniref:hypothetical protein n=1 Tax=Bradyrhizobium sp. SSUT77 TaxID=3040603 RepID=UPI00244B1D18|nr:hypothetical protein [Bradyrhizobium sp. SSUT77]MDH2340839.1 hypothetical protein [Bradyrhizobium sp. SSUT77]